MIRYCLPIIQTSQALVLHELDKHQAEYDFFEVWLDYLEDLNLEFISKLTERFGDRLILLFRRKELATIQMPTEQRLAIIDLISSANSWLDLDITQKAELDYLHSLTVAPPLICSMHNYQHTPSLEELRSCVKSMQAYQPQIYKIATFCCTKLDALRLLELQTEFEREQIRHIILGMGPIGIITRIFATLGGNEMLFVAQAKGNGSAAGQTTRIEMARIFASIAACDLGE